MYWYGHAWPAEGIWHGVVSWLIYWYGHAWPAEGIWHGKPLHPFEKKLKAMGLESVEWFQSYLRNRW